MINTEPAQETDEPGIAIKKVHFRGEQKIVIT